MEADFSGFLEDFLACFLADEEAEVQAKFSDHVGRGINVEMISTETSEVHTG